MFIARVSRGRSVREFQVAVLFVLSLTKAILAHVADEARPVHALWRPPGRAPPAPVLR